MEDRYGSASGYLLHGPWTVTPNHGEASSTGNVSGFNTVSSRFEVASNNASSSSATWDDAVRMCTDGWRLPTIRELSVICALSGLNNVGSFNDKYWAATERSTITTNAYYMDFGKDYAGFSSKTDSRFLVRCVRDL